MTAAPPAPLPPPPGFTGFMMHNPALCAESTPASIADSWFGWVEQVGRYWNHAIRYGGDTRGSWRVLPPNSTGVCRDYAVTKLDALVKAGVAAGGLSLCHCHRDQDPDSLSHLVLLVRFQRGIYVMDNCDDRLLTPFYCSNYRWLAHQAFGSPTTWLAGRP